MAYKKEVKQAVRDKYINGLSLAAAAKVYDVSTVTVNRWKAIDLASGDNWDKQKTAKAISLGSDNNLVENTLSLFLEVYQQTLKELKTTNMEGTERADVLTSLADAYAKTTKAAGKADPTVYELSIVLDVISRQIEFVKTHYPEELKSFIAISQQFSKEEVPQHYGNKR